MKILHRKMPDSYTVVQTQDWHLGAASVHMDGIKDCIGRIEEPGVYASLPGDLVEAIAPEDKRFAFTSCDPERRTAQEQCRTAGDLLKPVGPKVIGLGVGNHEWKLINKWDVARDICERIGREDAYGGWSYKLEAHTADDELMHKMFFTHGNCALNSQAKDPVQELANMMAKLKNVLVKTGWSDCIYMGQGHTHRLMVTLPTINEKPTLITKDGKIHNVRRTHTDQTADYIPVEARFYGNGGAFMKAYADPDSDIITYAEVMGLGALDFGWLEIDVEDRQVVNVRKVVV